MSETGSADYGRIPTWDEGIEQLRAKLVRVLGQEQHLTVNDCRVIQYLIGCRTASQMPYEEDRAGSRRTARALVADALFLRMYGERPPGAPVDPQGETWAGWDRRAERFLRAVPDAEPADDGTCKRSDCPNFGGVWRDCPPP